MYVVKTEKPDLSLLLIRLAWHQKGWRFLAAWLTKTCRRRSGVCRRSLSQPPLKGQTRNGGTCGELVLALQIPASRFWFLYDLLCDVKILALRLRFLCDLFCVLSKTRNWHAPFIVDAKMAIWLFWLLRCNYPCLGAELWTSYPWWVAWVERDNGFLGF